jgi:hypothetical protein
VATNKNFQTRVPQPDHHACLRRQIAVPSRDKLAYFTDAVIGAVRNGEAIEVKGLTHG